MSAGTILKVDGLSFRYPGRAEAALREVSFTAAPGSFVGVTGPAGAGKSTLCYCLNGVIPHYKRGQREGAVVVADRSVETIGLSEISRYVGTVFEDPDFQMVSETVEEEVAFGPEHTGVASDRIPEQVDYALRALRIGSMRTRVISTLSGGEKQRVAIAASIASRPPILVLDEPTSELDPAGTEEVFAALRSLNRDHGITVILVSHAIEHLAAHADSLIVLDRGAVVASGEPHSVLRDVESLDRSGVAVPAVVRLATRFQRDFGWKPPNGRLPLTLAEAVEVLPGPTGHSRSPAAGDPGRVKYGFREQKAAEDPVPALETTDLTHRYANGVQALKGISVAIARGEFTAIIGHNGSGKTTFAKHLNGLLRATGGEVRIEGRPVGRRRVSELARTVGYVFQNPDHQIFNPTVLDEASFGPRNLEAAPKEIEAAVAEALTAVGLLGLETALPADLSKGQRQRLAVASILAMRPQVVVIDEPTTGQDYREGRAMMELARKLNEMGRTVLFITHDMDLVAEFAQRVLVFGDGRLLLDGPPRQVFGEVDALHQAGLRPPQITRLGQALGDRVPQTVLDLDELVDALRPEAVVRRDV